MTRYVLALSVFGLAFLNAPFLYANGLVVRTTGGNVVGHAPSLLRMAKRYESKGDYITAILIYDELLNHDPSNMYIFRKMIKFHEAMLQKEIKDAVRNQPHEQGKALGPQIPDLPEDGFLSDPLELSPIACHTTRLSVLP